jgi:hypothetical protein
MATGYNENDFHFHYNHGASNRQSLFSEKAFSDDLSGWPGASKVYPLFFKKLDNKKRYLYNHFKNREKEAENERISAFRGKRDPASSDYPYHGQAIGSGGQ